jgi:hypothetical protein
VGGGKGEGGREGKGHKGDVVEIEMGVRRRRFKSVILLVLFFFQPPE